MRDLQLEYIAYHWQRLTPCQKRRLIWLARWLAIQSQARRLWESIKP